MLHNIIRSAQNGNQDAMLLLIEKFSPLLQKYARKLNNEDAESELTLAFIELITAFNLEKMQCSSDGAVVNYISHSIHHSYIKLLKRAIAYKVETVSVDELTDKALLSYSLSVESLSI